MNKKHQSDEPSLHAATIREMIEKISKNNMIPLEFRKEFIKALKLVFKYLKSSGKSMTPSQINEHPEKKGQRKIFGIAESK